MNPHNPEGMLSQAVSSKCRKSSKPLLADADIVQLCSVLLMHGPERLRDLLTELENWLVGHEYESIQQLKGSVSQQHAIDPSAYERANYVQVLDNYSYPAGVMR